MLKKIKLLFVFYSLGITLFSCAVSPVRTDVKILNELKDTTGMGPNEVKVLVYNKNSKFHIGATGMVNVRINGKGVCRLAEDSFVTFVAEKGNVIFELEHRDAVLFSSTHNVTLDKDVNIIEISPTIISQDLKVVPELPSNFYDTYYFFKK